MADHDAEILAPELGARVKADPMTEGEQFAFAMLVVVLLTAACTAGFVMWWLSL